MKYYRNGEYIKIIPKEFENIIEEFPILSEGKRLTLTERTELSVMLCKSQIANYFKEVRYSNDRQIEFMLKYVKRHKFTGIVKVKHHDFTSDLRIKYGNMEFRIPSNVLSKYPEKLMEIRNE